MLVEALTPIFKRQPELLSHPPASAGKFLTQLVDAAGPVVIMLDGFESGIVSEGMDRDKVTEGFLSIRSRIFDIRLRYRNLFFIRAENPAFYDHIGSHRFRLFAGYRFRLLRVKLY